jgi:flagellar motility protein MotE (MotC chaperone)
MKPDAAAQQLSALDEETAAAVLIKLSPKISSALMAEMDAKKAARLTAIIAGSSKGPKGKPPATPPSGGT